MTDCTERISKRKRADNAASSERISEHKLRPVQWDEWRHLSAAGYGKGDLVWYV
jgi:hypothetical protein